MLRFPSSRRTSPLVFVERKTIERFTSMRPPVAAAAPRLLGMATSAIWKATYRPWLETKDPKPFTWIATAKTILVKHRRAKKFSPKWDATTMPGKNAVQ